MQKYIIPSKNLIGTGKKTYIWNMPVMPCGTLKKSNIAMRFKPSATEDGHRGQIMIIQTV